MPTEPTFTEALDALKKGAAEMRRSADVLDALLDHLTRELNDDGEDGK